ncbi:M56 family metallopeptidase [Paenibacillus sp. J31TS4]|uniref:M56 family metallopeptidase n=1 Tax=Paenibacillus sp. J31TS4 TaxID=2807195 RepID=UPI001BCFDAB9|nr:M56 family metallopeptidase [Paenibacillus sp. J31TS4]
MPFKPKVILALIFCLVSWILFQMGYNIFHQLNDLPGTDNTSQLVIAILRDLTLSHVIMGQLYNGFIAYFCIAAIYYFTEQFILRIKLQRYIKERFDPQSTLTWNDRFRHEQTKIIVIKDSSFVAMSYGILKPKILISTYVLSKFTEVEIEAILHHEVYHCKSRHPFQMNMLTFLSKGLAFVPVIKDLSRYYSIWAELLADRYAINRMNSEVPIGKVLLSLVKGNTNHAVGAGTHFANEAVNYRIKQIIDPSSDLRIVITTEKTVIISAVVLVLKFLLLIGK